MGAGNVKAVYVSWGRLNDAPFRLLVYMALRAHDGHSPPLYWGGREDLAMGAGRREPFTDSDWRAVQRSLRALRDAGAIALDRGSAPGARNARYALQLVPVATGDAERHVSNPATGDAERHVNGCRSVEATGDAEWSEQVSLSDGTGDGDRHLEEEQEERGLTEGEKNSSSPVPHPPAERVHFDSSIEARTRRIADARRAATG